jgi:glycosyltransferase involved in cell wall biosynthesis
MDFSVIVPALNEEKRIRRCLNSIKAQCTSYSYELIVSDSGSSDRTVDIAREYTDKIQICSERGTARARNEGAQLAMGDVLVFIDSDTEIQRDYLETVGKAFEDKELIACSCAFKFSGREPKLLLAESVTNTYYLGRSLFRGTTLPGFNVCIRREAFEKLHGFRLCNLEDLDMSIKLRRMGRTRYLPRRKAITSSRRIETDGLRGTLKYYADLFEQTQGRRLGFEPIKLRRTEFVDYVQRE